ncbi:hypothetical protein SAMN05192583_0581 [Sphingomonas gellani]|uniref:Uncharacterized protein n=1 Tax=Sphingomonas gellani TaxID=1166340 RepID=A0A1H7Z8X7_9SPHN|nr:hypothetical protein [Sphingomonas gellani]SEM54683.1 hypothetical protein SAMN05192583_0581 [Sphingomonas gellani]
MSGERIHHVIRIGSVGATGREAKDRATSDRVIATARPGYYVGRWIVRDHDATLTGLCGPWGRV